MNQEKWQSHTWNFKNNTSFDALSEKENFLLQRLFLTSNALAVYGQFLDFEQKAVEVSMMQQYSFFYMIRFFSVTDLT